MRVNAVSQKKWQDREAWRELMLEGTETGPSSGWWREAQRGRRAGEVMEGQDKGLPGIFGTQLLIR